MEHQPRKRPKQKRSRQTVEAILEATARVLVEGGYDKVNTNHIAEIAGVSIGTLYQYFPNKESLVMAVFEGHSHDMLELLQQSVLASADAPIEEAVRTYVRAMLAAHRVDPALHRVLIMQALHLGFEFLMMMQERAIGIVRLYLEQHKERLLPEDLDLAAFMLVTMVESITHNAILEGSSYLGTEGLALEIERVVLRYLLPSAGLE